MIRPATGFAQGDGFGIVTDDVLVLLGPEAVDAVPELQRRLAEHANADVDVVLEVLAGVGLRNLGGFAVAAREVDATRVIVRGGARAYLGSVAVDGGGLRTWNERVISGNGPIVLALEGFEPKAAIFEVVSGVVPATGLVHPSRTDVCAISDDPRGEEAPADVTPDEPATGPAEPPAPAGRSESSLALPEQTLIGRGPDGGGELPMPVEAPEPSRYDELYGHTVQRSVQTAAMQPVDEQPPPAPTGSADVAVAAAGDHDGRTISLATLRELQQAEATGVTSAGHAALGDHDGHTISLAQLRELPYGAPSEPQPPLGGPTVQALTCRSGHHNPTHLTACSRCRSPLSNAPVTIPRPALGRLRLSTGEVVDLDRPLVIGRNPRIEGNLPGELPRLVRLEAFQGLSRSHAMVRLEGWQVLLVDLGSANHTTVTVPGRSPRRLHADEPMLLTHGASIDLAGEVTAIYDADI